MFKRWSEFLSSVPMTAVGGMSLLISLGMEWMGYALPLDPAWVSVVICGLPLVYLAILRMLKNSGVRKISSAFLISIAMFAAIGIGDLFAAGEVAFIMAIGAIIEEKTTKRAKKGLKKLVSLAPEEGRRIANGREERIPARDIRKGDVLRILPGESIPADGKIVSGNTSVDQSVLTGESLPVDKGVGDLVLCGTLNRFGSIDICVTKSGAESSLHKLIRMVREAEEHKAPMERIADVWASWLVPVALLIAVLAYFLTGEIVRAVTVLVVFCPCALVLATPTAVMAAIGQATKHGVIVKSGAALECMGKVDTIAFDKTGTLTLGKLEVADVAAWEDGMSEETLLCLAAAAEARSEHPLAKALLRCARERGIAELQSTDFQMAAGKGIAAQVGGKRILCGNAAYLKENGIPIAPKNKERWLPFVREGKATILVAVQGKLCGVLAFSDILRLEAETVISRLRSMGVRSLLLTGDTPEAAGYFARKIGIEDARAGLLPEDKVTNIVRAQKEGRRVCMIGDGVNDAPSLKAADVGVAMADMGSDIAVDAADIALMKDDISRIPYLKRLGSATVQTIKISIGMSLCINFVAILLSLQGVLTPTTGALVHNAGSCLVVLFAALLYDRDFHDADSRAGCAPVELSGQDGRRPTRNARYEGVGGCHLVSPELRQLLRMCIDGREPRR